MNVDMERVATESLLESRDLAVVKYAIRNLRKYNPDSISSALLKFIEYRPNGPSRSEQRIEALKILSETTTDQVRNTMLLMLQGERDPRVQATLITACFKRFGNSPFLMERLVPLLSSDDPRVVANTIEVMGWQGPEEVRVRLKDFLFSENPRQSMNAAVAFHRSGEEKIYNFISLKAFSQEEAWAKSAAFAMGEVRNSKSSTDLMKLLPNSVASVKSSILKGLSKVADNESLSPVISCLLVEKDRQIQASYVSAMKAINEDLAISKLIEVYETTGSSRIQATVVGALGHFDSPRSSDIMLKGLRSSDSRVVANSIESAAHTRSENLLPILMELTESRNRRIRANAAVALWKSGFAASSRIFREMLGNGDPESAGSAKWAIDCLGIQHLFA